MSESDFAKIIIFLLGVIVALLSYCWSQLTAMINEMKASHMKLMEKQIALDRDFALKLQSIDQRVVNIEGRLHDK